MGQYFIDFYLHQMFGINYIMTNLLFAISVVFIFNDYDYRWKGLLLKLADLAVTYLVSFFIFSLFYMLFAPIYMQFIVWPLVVAGHVFFCNKFRWFDRLMKGLALTSSLELVFPISADIGSILNLHTEDFIFVFTLTAIASFVLKRYSLENFRKINVPCLVAESLITVAAFAIVIILNLGEGTNIPVRAGLALQLIVYFMSFLTVYMFYIISYEQETLMKEQALDMKNYSDYMMSKLTKENMEDIRKMRHDMKNQYQYMRTLLANKDYERLNSFFSDMEEESFIPLNFIDCGNNAVSGVMNMEVHKSIESNIALKSTILVPASLSISDYDLCRFLSNIIDNAIEGTLRDRKDEKESKTITVNLRYKDPYLILEVKNPVSEAIKPEQRLKLKTSKDNSFRHGYGTKIVGDIVKKYDGSISYEVKDGCFIVSAMLMTKDETADNEGGTEAHGWKDSAENRDYR
jgi:hypothetical protein